MLQTLINNESLWRSGVFAVIFGLFAATEYYWPRRQPLSPLRQRWPNNLGLALLGSLSLRLLLPILAVGTAGIAVNNHWGLLNQIQLSLFWRCLIAIILLDLAIYAQHVLFHRIPVLWRLHRVHHSDTDFDVSNALRFHPIEIVLSMLIKMGLVMMIGVPPVAVVLFEIVLNGMAIFNHSNTQLPKALDRALRWMVVTPDFHRIHHSVHSFETNSNYGFNCSLWDRIFRTYTPQPRDGHRDMLIGLDVLRNPEEMRLDKLITQPFRDPTKKSQKP